jgi:hypothetical protein
VALALLAGCGTTPVRRSGSAAIDACLHAADDNLDLLAEYSLVEFDRFVETNVASLLHAGGLAASAYIESEEIAEDVAEIRHSGEGIAVAVSYTRDAGMPVAVIGGSLLRIGEDLVGFAALFEFLFRFRIVRIAIRVVLHGEFAIGGFQLLVGSAARHT